MGVGYAYVLQLAGEDVAQDLDQVAAEDRFACYRFFGAQLPVDGGVTALTPKVVAAARKQATKDQIQPRHELSIYRNLTPDRASTKEIAKREPVLRKTLTWLDSHLNIQELEPGQSA